MLNGKVDFVVVDNAPATALVAANKGTKMIDIALTTESYGIAVGKNDSELLASDIALSDLFEEAGNMGYLSPLSSSVMVKIKLRDDL